MRRCFYCGKVIWFWQKTQCPSPAITGRIIDIEWHLNCVQNMREQHLMKMKRENEKYDR